MATAVAELIIDKVRTRLGDIKVSGGYEVTVSEVVRPTRYGGFRPQDLQLVVTQGTLERNADLSHPGNPPATAWDMEVIVAGLLMPSESSTSKIDTLRNQFAADHLHPSGQLAQLGHAGHPHRNRKRRRCDDRGVQRV
jgi:hypothetical protein